MVASEQGDLEVRQRTLWCGGLSQQVDDRLLYELFLNAGPLEKVTIPRDRVLHCRGLRFMVLLIPALLCHKDTAEGTQSPLLGAFLSFHCVFMA